MYAKQGSACLLLQNAQTNSSGSLIPTPNLTKTGSKSSVCNVIIIFFDDLTELSQLIFGKALQKS